MMTSKFKAVIYYHYLCFLHTFFCIFVVSFDICTLVTKVELLVCGLMVQCVIFKGEGDNADLLDHVSVGER